MSQNRLILIADDSADDLFLLKRAFKRVGVINPSVEVCSGQEVISYLRGEGRFADRQKFPFPGILLLDLKMPNGDGFEVLQWIRNKLSVRGLLIIVLSSINEMENINRAYSLGANSFLTKPGSPEELQQLVQSFQEYWILKNRPPQQESF